MTHHPPGAGHMHAPSFFRKHLVVETDTGYAVAYVSVRGDLVALSEHGTPESAQDECRQLTKQQRVSAFLKTAEKPAHQPRFARPVRWFEPDQFA